MSNIKKFNVKQKNNNRAKRGISPVIATVILVAVAVVIAAAMAGFSSSLFGTYSENSQVSVTDVQLTAATNVAVIAFDNAGASADSVSRVTISGVGSSTTFTPNANIAANTVGVDITTGAIGTAGTGLTAGQQVTMVIDLNSGASITQSVTAQ